MSLQIVFIARITVNVVCPQILPGAENAGVENAGVENAGADSSGGKWRS